MIRIVLALATVTAVCADEFFPIVSPELQVDLFAQEPLVRNPCALAFDAQGRLCVGMGPQYRNPQPDTPGDSVFILVDADGDGRADARKEFATGFNCIQGLAWKGGALWVANSPDLTVVRDLDGDDVADEYVRLYTDLGNLEHALHGLNWAPDGKLYMSKGNSKGLNQPPGRVAPKPFRDLWGVQAPGAPDFPEPLKFRRENYQRNYHAPDDDWGREGGILRCDADGANLEIVARGFRNPWDISFDDGFNWLGTDNDQTLGDKIFSPFYGAHFGWGHPWSFDWEGEYHWPTVPASGPLFEGSGAGVVFCGVESYPEKYRGVFLINDWLRREVLIYRPRWEGARLRPENSPLELLASAGAGRSMDRSHGRKFDPVDIEIGPDDAIYISSWGRSYGAELQNGAMANEGRIYRLRPKGLAPTKLDLPRGPLAQWPAEALLARLASPLPVWRADAQEELIRRGAVQELEQVLERPGPKALRTWAAWTLGRMLSEERLLQRFGELARSPRVDLNLRIQALRILGHRRTFPIELASLLRDDQARLRLETALAIRQAKTREAAELLAQAAAREQDRVVFYALWGAMSELGTSEQKRAWLRSSEPGVRLAAALGALESDALSAGALQDLSRDSDPRVADLARRRLAGKAEAIIRGRPLQTVAPRPSQARRATVPEVLALLPNADARRGRDLFIDANAAGCIACHRLEGVGNVFAPDLSGIGQRADAEFIARSILEPSAAITEGFVKHLFITKESEEFSGIVLEETGSAVKIGLANGETVSLPVSLVAKRETTRESAMPSNYSEILTAGQIADLVSFLAKGGSGFAIAAGHGRLDLRFNSAPVATYVFQHEQMTRPALVNVHTRAGTLVTRPFPAPAEADHRWMHPGLSVSFGWLDGHDYWRGKARVRHGGFLVEPAASNDAARWTARNEYLSEDGSSIVCIEEASWEVRATDDGFLILLQCEFYNPEHDFVFGDQEESGLCLRLEPRLAVKNGTGTILNDRGDRNEAGAWGEEFNWIDYSGLTERSTRAGLLLLPHPGNPRASWSHCRDYGVLVANPFPRQPREQKDPVARTVVKKGERFRLGWSVVVYEKAR